MGFRFFIALRSSRELMALLPSQVMVPTLTFGPSNVGVVVSKIRNLRI